MAPGIPSMGTKLLEPGGEILSLVEVVYGIFFEPVKTLNYLARVKPLLWGMIIFLLILTLNIIINHGVNSFNSINFVLNDNFIGVFEVLLVFLAYLLLVILAGVFSLLSEILYHRGNASGILACFSYAAIPGVLGPPLHFAFILLEIKVIGVILYLASLAWVLVLQIISLREALHLRTSQAVLLFALPGVMLIFVLVVIVFGGYKVIAI